MSKRAFAFLALLLALCVAGSLLLGKYGFSAEDYARYVTALLGGRKLERFRGHAHALARDPPAAHTCVRDYGKKGSPLSSPTCRRRTRRPMTTASLTSR